MRYWINRRARELSRFMYSIDIPDDQARPFWIKRLMQLKQNKLINFKNFLKRI